MSIFTKITLLFSLSLLLMLSLGYQIDRINTERLESIVTQKYLQDAKKVFRWVATLPETELQSQLARIGLERHRLANDEPVATLLTRPHSFGGLSILKSSQGVYLLSIRYFDDTLVLIDRELQSSLEDEWLLDALVFTDMAVLVLMFLILLKMLTPLKSLSAAMKRFAGGDYGSRTEVAGQDEIAEVSFAYNEMAQNIESLIRSRQELLRDISHELRTPISRGMFALENLEASPPKETLTRSLSELERLTSELLKLEKLQSTQTLEKQVFGAETLIIEALSRLLVEDESAIEIVIRCNAAIEGDLDYLALALKNLIDNALKYATAYPVVITASKGSVSVCNPGKPLTHEIQKYLEAFVRDERARQSEGFGLGLNIVQNVLLHHGFGLSYRYDGGNHLFTMHVSGPDTHQDESDGLA